MESTLLCLAIAMIAGLLMSRITKVLKLPAVTGYLIAGILIGPFCLGKLGAYLNIDGLGFISSDAVMNFKIISEVALGFIAFSIGTEFRISEIKHIGKKAAVVGVFQALTALVAVDLALLVVHFIIPDKISLETVIVLGAIATATAPAATLMVVRQYKAKGPVTDILLPVVALDDAVGLIMFSISYGIAKTLASGELDVIAVICNPVIEICISLIFGAAIGILFNYTEKWFKSNTKRLCLAITFVLFAVAVSHLKFKIGHITIGFSSLLVCMMLGTVFCNLCKEQEEIMEKTDRWTAPLFVLFFVISGAELELSVFAQFFAVIIGIIYIIVRAVGKYCGAYFSAKMTKCEPNIVKYLGITLLPQAGVALGMSLQVASDKSLANGDGELIRNIALFAVLIYELIGPLLTKISLRKAGEITPQNDNPKNKTKR